MRVDSMWAFTCVDEDGTENVVAIQIYGVGVQLMGADLATIAKARPHAQEAATSIGRPVVLSHFTVRTDQETIQP